MSRRKWLKLPTEVVMVMWEDHCSTPDDDDPMLKPFRQQTVGFVAAENDEVLVLARDYDEDGSYYESMTIMKQNIKHKRKLR